MILKNFISILNRITESNYDSLFNELCKLEKINSKNIIDKSIQSLINNIKTNQVFQKHMQDYVMTYIVKTYGNIQIMKKCFNFRIYLLKILKMNFIKLNQ